MVKSVNGWTEERVKQMLGCSVAWQKKAVIVLYNNQDENEKFARVTKKKNGVGFNKFDADVLSRIALSAMKGKWEDWMTKMCSKKLPKYSGQILLAIDRKANS